MPTALQYIAIYKRCNRLKVKQEDKPARKQFSRRKMTLSGERKTTASESLELSASCEAERGQWGI